MTTRLVHGRQLFAGWQSDDACRRLRAWQLSVYRDRCANEEWRSQNNFLEEQMGVKHRPTVARKTSRRMERKYSSEPNRGFGKRFEYTKQRSGRKMILVHICENLTFYNCKCLFFVPTNGY